MVGVEGRGSYERNITSTEKECGLDSGTALSLHLPTKYLFLFWFTSSLDPSEACAMRTTSPSRSVETGQG